VNVQFDWWLLIVGLVIGAGLTWLVIADIRRREEDLDAREREAESAWIAAELTAEGIAADAEAVAQVLRLHRLYLASIPADDATADAGLEESESAPAEGTTATTDQQKDAWPLT
jgi:hypothetical protein